MFGGSLGDATRRYFERLLSERNDRLGAAGPALFDGGALRGGAARPIGDDEYGDMATPFLNFAIPVPRRHQTVMPAVGTLHDCCENSRLLASASQRLLFSSVVPREFGEGPAVEGDGASPSDRWAFLSPRLAKAAASLAFAEYGEAEAASHRNSYYSVMNSLRTMRASDAFRQLGGFMGNFARLLATSFKDATAERPPPAAARADGRAASAQPIKRARLDVAVYDRTRGTLELFQKMILMHATYFLASVVLSDHAERVEQFLRVAFDTPAFSDAVARHFRQRATVFLVPRRHGKTWFLVPLIALAMSSFEGIRIGYTSHIRKALEPVFDDIDARLRRWFGHDRVDHVKGETISFSFPSGSKSTVTFASSHNTNSIRGQDFNLLFVDEANFIRPDAVQTIVGFLNQANCKIIFVSSTNSGKASTSFLYGLKGSADGLLNVVTYICDEHMKQVTAHTNATSCSCYVLNKPVFITMDGAMRRTAELFLSDSFMQEIIGGGDFAGRGGDSDRSVFTQSAIDRFLLYRPSTVNNQDVISHDLYVYVDPAFTANTRASGTGVAVVGRYGGDFLVFGLEHFFLRALTGDSADAIGRCAAQCVAQICALHRRRFGSVRVAVEGNTSQDSAVAIAARVAVELGSYAESGVAAAPREIVFHHCVPPGGEVAYPIFMLHRQKTEAFDHFIGKFNSGRVMASQELVSTTVGLGTDPVEYLTRQLFNLSETVSGPSLNRTFSAKKGGRADDTLVALVMAVYLASFASPGAFAPLCLRARDY